MARFQPDPTWLDSLSGKVVVLPGGANGIGAATVKLSPSKGVFDDVNVAGAEEIIKQTSSETVHFQKCDASDYGDNLVLFKAALQKYGHIDHAVANAGIKEQGLWFEPKGGLEGVEKEPSTAVLNVNLKGVMYFARIAPFLSSVAGFKETPGIPVYQAAKHGVLGLEIVAIVSAAYPGLRLNAVCPSMTLTGMVAGIKDCWVAIGAPVNQPIDVAHVIGDCRERTREGRRSSMNESQSAARQMGRNAGGTNWDDQSKGLNGRAIYVAGGEGWDVEEGLDRTEHLYLGQVPSGDLVKAQRSLGIGGDWLSRR